MGNWAWPRNKCWQKKITNKTGSICGEKLPKDSKSHFSNFREKGEIKHLSLELVSAICPKIPEVSYRSFML